MIGSTVECRRVPLALPLRTMGQTRQEVGRSSDPVPSRRPEMRRRVRHARRYCALRFVAVDPARVGGGPGPERDTGTVDLAVFDWATRGASTPWAKTAAARRFH